MQPSMARDLQELVGGGGASQSGVGWVLFRVSEECLHVNIHVGEGDHGGWCEGYIRI